MLKEHETATEPLLAVDSVAVRYRNGALGIEDVSLQVGEGQIVALLGPNGAGKTSAVRAISGFLRAEGARVSRGRIEVRGVDVTGNEPHQTAAMGISFVPERRKIFPRLTVGQNLELLSSRLSRREYHSGLERVYDLFPILRERRRQPAGQLSGGQQQMLAIARTVIGRTKLLIIDEMTLGLHYSVQGPLFDAVAAIATEGVAVLIVDESAGRAIEIADHCYVLEAGRVRLSGPPQSLGQGALFSPKGMPSNDV